MEKENELVSAVQSGNLDGVKDALKKGADINGRNTSGQTALHWSVLYGHVAIFDYLLDQGADATTGDNGQTTLSLAIEKKRDYFVARLEKAAWLQQQQKLPEWSLMGTSTLAHVASSPTVGQKLTEIFNFESRQHITILENLKTGAEQHLPVESFDNMDEIYIKKLFDTFTTLGGKADADIVMRRSRLPKKNTLPKQE